MGLIAMGKMGGFLKSECCGNEDEKEIDLY
jgi:hypothetical protein